MKVAKYGRRTASLALQSKITDRNEQQQKDNEQTNRSIGCMREDSSAPLGCATRFMRFLWCFCSLVFGPVLPTCKL